jgi:replicative DNA helicase
MADPAAGRSAGAVRRVSELLKEQDLPLNLEAERALLGAVLLSDHLFDEVHEQLASDDFALPSHRRIYTTFEQLREANRPLDLVTVTEWLHNKGWLEAVGGAEYVADLVSGIPRLTTLSHYAQIIRGRSLLRQLIERASGIIAEAYSSPQEPQEVLAQAEQRILELGDRTIRSTLMPLRTLAGEAAIKLDALSKRGEHVTGVATHFQKLDELTAGFQPSDFIILAARPSVGKTALALSIAYNVAKSGKSVAFFSLEMSAEQIFFRLLSMASGLDFQMIRTGKLNKARLAEAGMKMEEIAALPIYIDDSSAQTILEMGAKLRRLRTAQALDLVVVDYLQLIKVVGKIENRNQEVSLISRSLKALAKDLKVPVVALSQLSRAVEKRGEGREPMLSDLRDSGSLEQDADVVLFLHRQVFAREEDQDARNRARLLIAKQRNGPTDDMELTFLPWRVQFADYLPEAPEGMGV